MARKATGQVVERKWKRGRVFALRFSAYGERQYITLGMDSEGWTRKKAEEARENVMADVRRGIWRPPEVETQPDEPKPESTFHEFASEWFATREGEWEQRTREDYKWALSLHLLPFFRGHKLSRITTEEVDRYRAAKVREGLLSANSINKTLTRLSQVLEVAVEYGYLERNPARGKQRRCKGHRPRRASMGAEQVAALLEATTNRDHRAIIATSIMGGGLRSSEVTGLRRRDVDLATCKFRVAKSKTEAGVREVDICPELRDELALYLATVDLAPEDYLFPGREGKRRDRNAVRNRVLYPAIEKANAKLSKQELPTIPDGADGQPRVTFHSLRRTYASLAAEAGVDPAWTATQIGHRSSRFTLDTYTDVHNRSQSAAERIGSLISGSKGTSAFSNGNGSNGAVTENGSRITAEGH